MRSYEEAGATGLEVAVIGIAGKFPHAGSIGEYWNNLKNGVECISFFTDRELEESGVDEQLYGNPNYVRAKGFLSGTDYFDSSFFGYNPVEADVMDPQMRVFHECAWESLEDAGYIPGTYRVRIGVYAGAGAHLQWANLVRISGKTDILGGFASWQLYDKDFMSTRVSYSMNLLGPSMTINTACSTSLVAVHLACQGLLSGECHMALAGGVRVAIPGKIGNVYQEGMITASDGHCRTFDARADGTISGEGVGVVVLKPLENAVLDRDHIYAVIKSSAINNDGKDKVGYMAPNVKGQAGVIRSALQLARVRPESIGYLEAHGTGTNLGDPTEVEALIQAFKTGKKGFCRLGSVKSNLGHLDTAAGIAGFIKAVLALKHRQIPPSLHFEEPNPKINFKDSPFIVNSELYEWKRDGYPLRAGVSSFGAGGTNAHAILEEWECPGIAARKTGKREQAEEGREHQLILLSTRTGTALDRMTHNLVSHFRENPGINLADAAYTLAVGRKAFKHRKVLVTSSVGETIDSLSGPSSGDVHENVVKDDDRRVVFMFPGQGSQYVNMGLGLYRAVPVFREAAERCLDILKSLMGNDIKEILYPASELVSSPVARKINETGIAQPILFTIEYALAMLLMHWGIKPYAMVGHSIGEYTAACLSGVFSLEEALKIVVLRGRLMQKMPSGAMIGVSMARKDLVPLLPDDLSLAAVNNPSFCVISGTHEAVSGFSKKLEERNCRYSLLHTSHAFHSNMMDPILKEFEDNVALLSLNKPRIPYISNLTGKWITVEDAADPAYWAKHLRQTVQFSDGLEALLKEEDVVFVEVGPGKSLATFARKHPGKKNDHAVIDLIRHPKETASDNRFLMDRLGQLWLYGVGIDWTGFYSHWQQRRISLPTYPFEYLHYPISGDPLKLGLEMLAKKSRDLGKKKDMADWFYAPLWEKSVPLASEPFNTDMPCNWLVFSDTLGLASRLIETLEQAGQQVIVVNPGSRFREENDREFIVDPGQDNDYTCLFDELHRLNMIPDKILHLWGVTGNTPNGRAPGNEGIYTTHDTGFYSLLNIARSLGRLETEKDIQLGVVTDNVQEVIGGETLCPEKAVVLGAAKTIPLEYPNLRCCCMDIEPFLTFTETGISTGEKLADLLLAEFSANLPDQVIALRRNHRWIQTIKPVPLAEPGEQMPLLRQGGVYLITGGLGGIGLTLGQYLAASMGARLVIIGRSTFPGREEWDQWLAHHVEADQTSEKIRKLLEIEQCGGRVLVLKADVADLEQMQEVIRLTREQFGGINGVIHAAGVPDGGIIQRRTREMTEKVFAPKIKGTLVLDQILKTEPLDFFVLCSSLSSFLAPIGQVAYSAANWFQDAFASYKAAGTDGIFTVSINWDAWQEIGMAAEAVKKRTGSKNFPATPVEKVPHPLFDYCLETSSQEKRYITDYRVDKHWVLDEHRLLGRPTLPGTALVEMARAAFEHYTGNQVMEFREFSFLTPFRIDEGDRKEVQTVIKKDGDHYKLIIRSRLNSSADQWQEHARGELAELAEPVPIKKHDINEILESCNEGEVMVTGDMLETSEPLGELNIVLGQRWKSLKRVNHQDNRVLLLLELPEAFSGDIGVYKLHPSLLDSAVGYYGKKHADESSLPFSYKGMKIKAPLSRRLYSYMRYDRQKQEKDQFLKYTITIMDEQGQELVDIEEYRRLIINEDARTRLKDEVSGSPVQETASGPGNKGDDLLEHGLLPSEGIEVFRRILGRKLPRVAVSTIDFAGRVEALREVNKANVLNELVPAAHQGPLRPRPEINRAFIAPASETEQKISEIWQKFLGLEQIGINDNFFELGGDSLMLIQVNSQLEKTLKKDIPVVTLYDNPTIKSLSQYLSRGDMQPGISSEEKERMKEMKKKGKNTLKQRKQRRQGL